MGYQICKLKRKDGTVRGWKLILREYELGVRKDTHVPINQFQKHGFTKELTLDEAKSRAAQLNAQASVEAKKERKSKLSSALAVRDNQHNENAHFPTVIREEFEKHYLKRKLDYGPTGPKKYAKALSHWAYVKKMIVAVDLKPQDWTDEARSFYQYFANQTCSMDYAQKLIRILNLWGYFFAKKTGTPFMPVPNPRGYDRQVVADSYRVANKPQKDSAPLAPSTLEKAESKLSPENYRWIYISLWFGLRPLEVDSLKKQNSYRIVNDSKTNTMILEVYQSKLTGLAEEKRWKRIPCITSEQERAVEYILAKSFKRPLVKTMKKHLDSKLTLYAGRKGFVEVMLQLGQKLEHISAWMGHSSLDRTWKSYKDKQLIDFTVVTKKKTA